MTNLPRAGASAPKAEEAPAAADGADEAADEVAVDDAGEIEQREFVVDAAGHGERLDRVLAAAVPEFSRSYLQQLAAAGHVQLDGAACTTVARRLRAGQRLRVELVPTAESRAFRAQPMQLPLVYEDEHLLVVDKPAGLVVHPAAGNWSGTLLNGLLAHHRPAAQLPRAGIVHRLDKDTSGLMVVGKTLEAVTALVRAIAAREVQRRYLAIAQGEVARERFVVDAPIGRDPHQRTRMAVLAQGKPARTDVERLAVAAGCSALRCTLHTGRTHQIRVHLAHVGHALVGDAVYGGRQALGMHRQALHAQQLAFLHPASGAAMDLRAPLPPDLRLAWESFDIA